MKPTDPQFKLRLPPGLKKQLEESAVASGKTLTAEIVGRLESTFERQQELFTAEALRGALESLKTEVASMKSGMANAINLDVRPDKSVAIYGAHGSAYIELMRHGIEAEEKHDHHLVRPPDAAKAVRLLISNGTFNIVGPAPVVSHKKAPR